MRTILVLLGLAVLVIVALIWMGLINVSGTTGTLPTVSVQGGQAPTVDADVAHVSVGTENKTVAVPTIEVEKPANAQ